MLNLIVIWGKSKAWDVSLSQPIFKNESAWCNYISTNISPSTNVPLSLPAGVALFVETELGMLFHGTLSEAPAV